MRITKSWLRDAKRSLRGWILVVVRMADDLLLEEFKKRYPYRSADLTPGSAVELRAELVQWGFDKWMPAHLTD